MASTAEVSDATILQATNKKQRQARRQAGKDAEAQSLIQQGTGQRRAKVAAMEKDWNEIINSRTSKRAGNSSGPKTRKRAKLSDDGETDDEDGHIVRKSSSRTKTPRNTKPKKRKNVVEIDVPSTSDSDSSSNSKKTSASEDDERFSDDELAKKVPRMSDKDFRDMYNVERVKIVRASELFDSDDNVVKVPTRSSSESSKSSPWETGPSTSEADVDENANGGGPTKHAKKTSGKRDEVFSKERAQVRTTRELASVRPTNRSRRSRMNAAQPLSPPADSSDDDLPGVDDLPVSRGKSKEQSAHDAELRWPLEVRILYDDGIKIRQQNPVIKTIIAETIHRCEVHMITKDAFPETGQREKFRYEIAKRAIKSLRTNMTPNGDYKEAYNRATKDTNFIHKLGEVAVDRLSHYRSEMRAAAMTHIAVYQLGIGDICGQRVAALLKGNVFVYEGHWGLDGKEEAWVIKQRSAFLNPAIVDTIKMAWFGSDRTLGNQHQHVYTSSLPEHPNEKEFTIPLVALAATCVHAALSNWKTGYSQGKAQQFRGELVVETYATFSDALKGFKTESPVEFHSFMSALYTAVCGVRGKGREVGLGENPFAVFDLVGM